jgi:CheY-like chemotaxis protein
MTDPDYRVLIVDDTRAIHDDLRKVLGCSQGDTPVAAFDMMDAELFGSAQPQPPPLRVSCDSAYQGEEALDMLERGIAAARPYAVAFVDMRMPPGWDGVETIAQLWRVDPELQVIVCTAHSERSWTEIINALGKRENLLLLKKPFAPDEVSQSMIALTQNWSLKQKLAGHVTEVLRLSQRHEALGQLAAGAVHQITDPLACMRRVLDEIDVEPRNRGGAFAELRKALDEVDRGARRIAEIASGLLTCSCSTRERSVEP